MTKSKVTHAEKIYYSQLQTWEELSERYEQTLNNIKISKQYLGIQQPTRRGKSSNSQNHHNNQNYPNNFNDNNMNEERPFQLSPQEEDIFENLLGSQVNSYFLFFLFYFHFFSFLFCFILINSL